MIQRINQEWEFFEAIHAFMTRKTTNLHSYAVTQKLPKSATAAIRSDGGNEAIAMTNIVAHVEQEEGGNRDGDADDDDDNGNVTAAQSLSRTHEQRATPSSSLLKLQHDCAKENIPNNATILLQVAGSAPRVAVADGMQMFSSDTNEEFEVIGHTGVGGGDGGETDDREVKDSKGCGRNTDHDFYSKRSAVVGAVGACKFQFPIERQLHYFMDTSEESIGTEYVQHTSSMDSSLPSVMENIELHTENARTFEIKAENISQSFAATTTTTTIVKQENFSMTEMPSTSTESNMKTTTQRQNPTSTSATLPSASTTQNRMNERDRYYRHKRRFNRRLEKRFDALLNVVGQVVKVEYPTVDVKPLIDTVTSLATGLGQILSSESEDGAADDDSDATETHPK